MWKSVRQLQLLLMPHLTLLPPSTMTFHSTGHSTPSAANPPVDTVPVEVDGTLVTSGDTVAVTGNEPHLTPLSSSTMACPSTGQSTPSAANPAVNTVSVEVDGTLVTSGDTVAVTGNEPHLTPTTLHNGMPFHWSVYTECCQPSY